MRKYNSNSISRNNKYNGAGGGGTASDIAYDNSLSGLVSENVQQAIDELHDEIEIGSIYTTDEKKVGEWIDGKPIYQRVYTINASLSKNGTNVYDKIDNLNVIENVIEARGVRILDGKLKPATMPVSAWYESESSFILYSIEDFNGFNYLIMQYTKTTD